MTSTKNNSILKEAITKLSSDVRSTIFFSFFVNLLVLAPSWYMLEVYDRVLNSQNYRTLLMLTIMVLIIYLVLEALEWVRSKVMHQASMKFDESLRDSVFNSIFQAKLKQISGGSAQALSDLKVIQDAIASPALMALIDTPFALLTLILIFWINSILGWFAVCGAIILTIIAVINQYTVQPVLTKANQHAIAAQNYAYSTLQNAQVIEAMGMLNRIHKKWIQKQHQFLNMQMISSDRAAINGSLSKLTQILQGSLLLGLGCWLTLEGELSIGGSMMIIASILGARMLAPLIVIVTNWRVIMNAIDAAQRLDHFLEFYAEPKPTIALPSLQGQLSVEGAVACPPNSQIPILKGITFRLNAGQSLGILGPSAAGKSTLARILMGIWPTISGKVRLDGADVYTWKKSELGTFVGYLPQNVELFDGTIAENIARFGNVDINKVIEASKIVGLDTYISTLKDGYESLLGENGTFLSGGQRQRVALARAIYGMPKFVVLDEPNSSLDEEGDIALLHTLEVMKSKGTTLVIITHRAQVLSVIDSLLILVEGQVTASGPRGDVLKAINQQNQSTSSTPVNT